MRYVIEGSVQSAADKIRINVQLIDADTRTHLWAERFDKPRTDPLMMQDEISSRLRCALHVALVHAERQRVGRSRRDPANAMDLALRGWAMKLRPSSLEHSREARSFEAALRLDGTHLSALLGLAGTAQNEANSAACKDPCGQLGLAAEAALGREHLAAELCATGRRLNPYYSIGRMRLVLSSNANSAFRAQRERLETTLRKAGVPE